MSDCENTCGVAGWGVVRIPWAEIPHRRKHPGEASGLNAAANLKLADEQAVVALAALLDACARSAWDPTGFRDWGVVAAPQYIGRARLAPCFRRFKKMGARGVSPLIIPTMSNHAIAGTVCLILGSHGPNFGVGGSTPFVDELILDAISLCDGRTCPGVWAIMTAWTPEPIPDGDGGSLTPAVGVGVALALTSGAMGQAFLSIQLRDDERENALSSQSRGTVFELADFLEHATFGAALRCPLLGGGFVEFNHGAALSSIPLRRAG